MVAAGSMRGRRGSMKEEESVNNNENLASSKITFNQQRSIMLNSGQACPIPRPEGITNGGRRSRRAPNLLGEHHIKLHRRQHSSGLRFHLLHTDIITSPNNI